MNSISDVIEKKADCQQLSDAEIMVIVDAIAANVISEVQLGAFLMAVRINNMTFDEIASLARAMLSYGYHLRWMKSWAFQVVDQHSTGGVGDKVSVILAPAVAACGGKVPMIASRALGFCGGTLDMLETIPGFYGDLSVHEMIGAVEHNGVFIASQSEYVSPVGRKLHDCRNASGTVLSDPLTIASIMSNKIIEGLEGLVLDIKVGKAGMIKSTDRALKVAQSMIEISRMAGIRAVAILTRMDFPIGRTIGSALEMAEAFQGLNDDMTEDLRELVEAQGGLMLWLTGLASGPKEGGLAIREALVSGRALRSFHMMLLAQGVTPQLASRLCSKMKMHVSGYLQMMGRMSTRRTWIKARRTGIITDMDTKLLAETLLRLASRGLGKPADPTVGFHLQCRIGDRICEDESWMEVYHHDPLSDTVYRSLKDAITIQDFVSDPSNCSLILQTLNAEFV